VKSASELLAKFIENSKDSVFQTPQSQGHAAMLAEEPDPQWSPVASGQLHDYLTQQLGDRFEFPVIECQTDICEIQAAGYANGNLDSDMRDFQMIVNNMHRQPWWNELGFDEQTLSTTQKQARPLFIVYVTRK